MHRNITVDVCRGMLFILMVNSHALAISGVPRDSFLFSDLWLPNGWATVVFVVLSGYGLGFVYSVRNSVDKSKISMRERSFTVFLVMVISNFFFLGMKLVVNGDIETLYDFYWWLGLVTLKTEWTISGVLLPTAVILFLGSVIIAFIKKYNWLSLFTFISAKILLTILAEGLGGSEIRNSWIVKIMFLEGLGGFPVAPFVTNGFIGVWLGMQFHINRKIWLNAMYLFIISQVIYYMVSDMRQLPVLMIILYSISPIGKFAIVFCIAYLISIKFKSKITGPLQLIGYYSLGSFIFHRIFLQAFAVFFIMFGLNKISYEYRFAILLVGTLFSVWLLCFARERLARLNCLLKHLKV
jgi:hypothetical protein